MPTHLVREHNKHVKKIRTTKNIKQMKQNIILRPIIMGSENRKHNRISLHRTETREQCRPWWWVISDCCLHVKKRIFFAHSTSLLPRVLASQDTGHHQTWRAYVPLSWESSLPSLRGVVGGLCLEVSRFARGSLTHSCIVFSWSETTSCSVSQKVGTELGQDPTSQARDRDTDHLRPSNLAARTLRSVEHTPSMFGYDSCRGEDSWRQSSVVCEKSTFFSLSRQAVEHNKRSQGLVWFQHHKGENLFRFLFSDPIIVGLRWDRIQNSQEEHVLAEEQQITAAAQRKQHAEEKLAGIRAEKKKKIRKQGKK